MDYTNPEFWIAICVGGGVIGTLSAVQQVFSRNKDYPYDGIKYRAIFRDFFFGAFLTALLYMFLPESFHSLISAGQTTINKLTGGSSSIPITTDFEIQTGPARF